VSSRLRIAAVYVALVAMVLHALIPSGWMPSARAQAGSFFVICTVHGGQPLAPGDGKSHAPSDQQGTHHNDMCPFSAAPHGAPQPTLVQVSVPTLLALVHFDDRRIPAFRSAVVFGPRSPRGPPRFA